MENGSSNIGVMEKSSLEQFGLDKRQFEQLRLDKSLTTPFDNKHLHMGGGSSGKNHLGEHK